MALEFRCCERAGDNRKFEKVESLSIMEGSSLTITGRVVELPFEGPGDNRKFESVEESTILEGSSGGAEVRVEGVIIVLEERCSRES
jgi:hypothetical protein